jgi:hypothetical protein
MNPAAVERLETVLKDIRPSELSQLSTTEFSIMMAKLYGELDYIHPFPDGNSRTLRTFTKQLAEASGYHLDWTRFNQNIASRDVLYIARDRTVNKLAFPNLQSESAMRRINISMHQFSTNKDLSGLLQDVVRPIHPNKNIAPDRQTDLIQISEDAQSRGFILRKGEDLKRPVSGEIIVESPHHVLLKVSDMLAVSLMCDS